VSHLKADLRILRLPRALCLGAAFLVGSVAVPAFAQVTTTFNYDAAGRLVGSTDTAGNSTSYGYDDVNNIVSVDIGVGSSSGGGGGSTGGGSGGGGAGGNSAPVCADSQSSTYWGGHGMGGLTSCTDADGDTLTVTHATPPGGPTTVQIYEGSTVVFQNIQCGINYTTVTVSDGNGGLAYAVRRVDRLPHQYNNC